MPLKITTSFIYEIILNLCQLSLICVRLMLQGIRRAEFRRNSRPQKSNLMRREVTENSSCAVSVLEIMNMGFSNLKALRVLFESAHLMLLDKSSNEGRHGSRKEVDHNIGRFDSVADGCLRKCWGNSLSVYFLLARSVRGLK
jgi:hypothetical protein